ncbi:hypothetical protein ACLOJK_035247 [Asimina triloba]
MFLKLKKEGVESRISAAEHGRIPSSWVLSKSGECGDGRIRGRNGGRRSRRKAGHKDEADERLRLQEEEGRVGDPSPASSSAVVFPPASAAASEFQLSVK